MVDVRLIEARGFINETVTAALCSVTKSRQQEAHVLQSATDRLSKTEKRVGFVCHISATQGSDVAETPFSHELSEYVACYDVAHERSL